MSMDGEDTVRAVNHDKQELTTVQSERSTAVNNIFFNVVLKGSKKWSERKTKPWNTCWDFQSKSGCRKGVYCKWIHNSTTTPPFSRESSARWGGEYGGADERYRYGWRHEKDAQYAPQFPPEEESEIFYPEPTIFDFDPDTQRFVPKADARELSPGAQNGGKDLYFLSSKKYSKTTIERVELKSRKSDPQMTKLTLKSQVSSISVSPELQMAKLCKEAQSVIEVERTIKQDIPETIVENGVNQHSIESTGQKTPVCEESSLIILNDSNEATSLMTPSSGSESTILKTPESMAICNRTRDVNVHKSSMFMSPKPKSPSYLSLGDWYDACESSPIKTPIFKKLPMPPLKTDSQNAQFTPPKKESAKVTNSAKETLECKGKDELHSWERNWTKCSESLARMRSCIKRNSSPSEKSEAALKATRSFPKSFVNTSKQIPCHRGIDHHDMSLKNGVRVSENNLKDTTEQYCILLNSMSADVRSSLGDCEPSSPSLESSLPKEQNTVLMTPPPRIAGSTEEIAGLKEITPSHAVQSYVKTPNQATECLVSQEDGAWRAKTTSISPLKLVFVPPSEVPKITPRNGVSDGSLGSHLRSNLSMHGWTPGKNGGPPGLGIGKEGLRTFATFPKSGEHLEKKLNSGHGERVTAGGHFQGVARRGKPRILSPR